MELRTLEAAEVEGWLEVTEPKGRPNVIRGEVAEPEGQPTVARGEAMKLEG